MRFHLWSSGLPAALGTLFLACGPAWSDVIVLMNGCTLQGTLADRDAFAGNPHARSDVSILLGAGAGVQPELRRVPVAEIDFVVLETDGEKQVFDVRGVSTVSSARAHQGSSRANRRYPYTEEPGPRPASQSSGRTGGGVALLLAGAGVGIAGAVIDFDSNQYVVGWSLRTASDASTASSGITYDVRNYVLMGIGGVLMLTGIALIASPAHPPAPSVALEMAGGEPVVAYRHAF